MDEVPTISVGIVLTDHSAHSKAWDQTVTGVMRQLVPISKEIGESPLRLNIVFHVGGSAATDFVGVRTGRFNKRLSLLMVQVAPANRDEDARRAIALDLLQSAVDAAEVFARQRGLADDLPALRKAIQKVSAP